MTDNAGVAEPTRSGGGNENVSSDGGRKRYGYHGSNHHNNHRRKSNSNNFQMQSSMQFKGSEPSLKGHIYDFTREWNPNQFIKTTKQIKLFIRRMYIKYPADLHLKDHSGASEACKHWR